MELRSQSLSSELPPFDVVYQRYFDFVWSCVARSGIGDDALDDVVQEVFIVVHSRLHGLQKPEALRSWIYGIVRRTVSYHRRSRRAELAHDSCAMGAPPPAATPLELTERAAALELLHELLAGMDDAKREVLLLVELQELSVPEAAEALDIPLNTAYSRLRAARLALEAARERHLLREPGSRF